MSYEIYSGAPDDEQARIAYLMLLFSSARMNRVNFEVQWEEAAALCWPEYRNSFAFGHMRPPGIKYTQFQVDATGSIASHRFMSICDALLTPFNMLWSVVRASNPYLMKQRDARLYFQEVTKVLWAERYKAAANFMSQNQQNWHALGVFGNMGMLTDEMDSRPGRPSPGLRYISTSPGEMYKLVNHQGRTDGFIRHFRWTARQAYQRWPEMTNQVLKSALERADTLTLFDFLQFVIPRTDYDPNKFLSPKSKPWASIYVSMVGFCIMEEGGYRSFPWAVGGYMRAPEEIYDRGPAQMVLPELKTLNSEKEAFLKQGLQAGDPTYLLPEDGMFDFKAEPGSYNYGGMSEEGKPLVGILPVGKIEITKELMENSTLAVNDAFLVSLFPMLFKQDGAQKSPREVIEVANQMGIFLAPTLGRQYGEYLGTMINREVDIASYLGLLPPMPDVVREAKGEYQILYTSPLAKAISGQPIAGYMRTVEMALDVANKTQDQSIMDNFAFDRAIPAIATEQFAPEDWMASDQEKTQARKKRADAAERERQTMELPGKAAIMKAQAIQSKAGAGQNIGGTLSGTPQGGMPQVPGNPPGQPGQPGAPGQPGMPGQPAPGGQGG